jgi:hypothetical protein
VVIYAVRREGFFGVGKNISCFQFLPFNSSTLLQANSKVSFYLVSDKILLAVGTKLMQFSLCCAAAK